MEAAEGMYFSFPAKLLKQFWAKKNPKLKQSRAVKTLSRKKFKLNSGKTHVYFLDRKFLKFCQGLIPKIAEVR